MGNKNLEYDDVTLCAFADGELDEKTANQVEKDLTDNVELQQRLEVFTTTRKALLSMQDTDDKIPDKISKMIDDYQKPKKDSKVLHFFKKNPLKSVAASLIFGMLLGTQGVQRLMLATNEPVLEPSPKKVMMASKENQQFVKASMEIQRLIELESEEITISRDKKFFEQAVAEELINSLSKNASIKKTVMSYENKDIEIVFISDFINSSNQQCRLAQTKEIYFVACLVDDSKWLITN